MDGTLSVLPRKRGVPTIKMRPFVVGEENFACVQIVRRVFSRRFYGCD
jgi:hypothetical protein